MQTKILVTGSQGFVGRNLLAELKNRRYENICEFDIDTDPALLDSYTEECGFVFHLAGVNRPEKKEEFWAGNVGFTARLVDSLKKNANKAPVLMSSSIQAALDNDYGKSKKAGEDLLFAHARETGAKALVYRLPNVFGKWCRPNYNSAVATFCHNIARGLPVSVSDPRRPMKLAYIDDVVAEFINALNGEENLAGKFCEVPVLYNMTLGEIADLIYSFRKSREDLSVPDLSDGFTRKLYSTYTSYLPESQCSYALPMNSDHRGSFAEFIRTPDRGQVSVNIAKPGVVKGNHWHHAKNEKFLVVSGRGVIRLRRVGSDRVWEYHVSGEKMEVVDIPAGSAHNIENLGETDLVTIMWADEPFDPEKPDTYFLEV